MNNLDWLDAIARPEQVCPNMPQHAFEMLGRLEAPEYAMPQLPQHAPTQKSMKGAENKEESAPGGMGGQEIISAAETVLIHPSAVIDQAPLPCPDTQSRGHECGSCHNLSMVNHAPAEAHRRLFQWVCQAAHKPLAVGYGSERVSIAPPECQDWERWQPAR